MRTAQCQARILYRALHRRKREQRKLGGAPSRSKRTAWLTSCPSLMKECRIGRLVVGEGAPFDIEDFRRRSHRSFTRSHAHLKQCAITLAENFNGNKGV